METVINNSYTAYLTSAAHYMRLQVPFNCVVIYRINHYGGGGTCNGRPWGSCPRQKFRGLCKSLRAASTSFLMLRAALRSRLIHSILWCSLWKVRTECTFLTILLPFSSIPWLTRKLLPRISYLWCKQEVLHIIDNNIDNNMTKNMKYDILLFMHYINSSTIYTVKCFFKNFL